MKTESCKTGELEKRWFVVDADGKVLGRLASRIALILRGKHTAKYTPHVDTGDFVVVVNVDKLRLTGKKLTDKVYWRHSDYPGGLKGESAGKVVAKHPERALELAIKGMLPRTPLGRQMFRKLKIYAGPEHPHKAQKPEPLTV